MIRFEPIQFFSLGWLNISTHGLMIAIAVIFAFLLGSREAKKRGLDNQVCDGIMTWTIIGGILGARILYVIFNPALYTNFFDIIKIWEGGIVSFGGMIGGFLGVFFYLKKHHIDWVPYADVFAPYVVLGWGIGRIGDFLSWSEFGTQSAFPWAIDTGVGVPRHPTQLYSLIILTIGFFIIKKLVGKGSPPLNGYAFFLSSTYYFIHRFLIEFIRDYPGDMGIIFYRYVAQAMSLVLLGIVALWWLARKRNFLTSQ